MKKLILMSLPLLGVFFLGSHPAVSCTLTLNCNNGCNASVSECPPPYLPYSFSCSAPSQTFQCSGTNCTSDSTYVECDGNRQTCVPQQCFAGSTFADCGSTHLSCAKCQSHQISCIF